MHGNNYNTASMKSDKHKHAIRSLMDFLHLSARLEANKVTFSQFLGLSVVSSKQHSKNTESDNDKDINKDATILRADRFSFLDHHPLSNSSTSRLVFRYRFPSKNRLRYLNNNNNNNNNNDDDDDDDNDKQQYRGPSLSTYTSILDEVTTLGLIAASPKDTRPGVSVTMQSQWGAAHAPDPAQSSSSSLLLEEVDIVTTITKRGRTLAFVRAEVRDPSNNNDGVICYFDHVKYLPVGWMASLLFTPAGMWCLNLYLRYILPYVNTNTYQDGSGGGKSKNMDPMNSEHSNIMDSFQKTSDTTATFQFGEQHANGFGGLHGGVQAILMEYLGQSVAQNELSTFHLNSNNSNSSSSSSSSTSSDMVVECERLQISYQSSASRVLELRAHIMEPPRFGHPSVVLRIEILRSNKKSQIGSRNKPVVVSEGILTFTSATFLMKAKEQ
jgi:acyl-coenzyme A thioesterase PaaI-like protein